MKKPQLLILAGLFIFSTVLGQDEEPDSLEQAAREKWVGKVSPNWSLKSEDGHYEFLHNWTAPQGKQLRKPSTQPDRHIVVLIFFATWCPPCIEQLSFLEVNYQKYQKEGVKFFIVDLTEGTRKNPEDDYPKISDLFQEKGIAIPVLDDNQFFAVKKYDIKKIPTIFVIDTLQVIREVYFVSHDGVNWNYETDLSRIIDKLLDEQ